MTHDWQAEAVDWRSKTRQIERLARIGTFEHDVATNVMTWSLGTYAIFMVPPGLPVTFDQALEFFDQDARDDIGRHWDRAKRSGESFDLTVRFRSATGERGWARIVGQGETGARSPRVVGAIRDVTLEWAAEERLRLQAHQDMLTGLPNRRAFEEHLDQLVPDGSFALCIVDIDRFKVVNDIHGHAIGDGLLQDVGRRLVETVRTTDFVARLGGDEFAVVLHSMENRDDLRHRVGAMVETMRHPITSQGITLELTVSVGVYLVSARAASADNAIKRADIALYKAKAKGRDQFCLFQPSFHKEVEGHDRLLDEVGVGLAKQEFEVHYQPIVDLRTHIVRGWEALVRWNHPTQGLLLPGRFLEALTDPKTSVAIDDFVLTTSLSQMRQWLDAGVPVTCAGVNVSETQLKRPDLVAKITSLLQRYRLTPDRLKIEVLETAFVGHATESIAATIDHLARLGVVSALDDFGTGFASLTHLKQFRVERIKIDRSFVANLGADGYDQAIVRCMIALGRDLGIRITAEGIETGEQLRILCDLGCDCGQGYLFARPMRPEEVPAFLTRWHGGQAALLLGQNRPAPTRPPAA